MAGLVLARNAGDLVTDPIEDMCNFEQKGPCDQNTPEIIETEARHARMRATYDHEEAER